MSYFLIYLIKSTFYLALFYAFFMIAMRNTTFFRLNRLMLLLGTFVCMFLPLYTFTIEEIEGIQLPIQILDEMLVVQIPEYPETGEIHSTELLKFEKQTDCEVNGRACYVYTAEYDGSVMKISVDKENGLWLSVEDSGVVYTVTKFDFNADIIPEYK